MQTAEMIGAKAAYLEKVSIGAELHDDETGFHVYRVGSMVRELAQSMGTDPQTCRLLELGARQHDIGKLAVPESIMNKPGAFEPEERAIMETQAAEGARIIRELSKGLPQKHTAEEIAHAHHEKCGTGYPSFANVAAAVCRSRTAADQESSAIAFDCKAEER